MIMKLCFVCVFITLCFGQLEVNEDCFTGDTPGICRLLINCPKAVQKITQYIHHNLTRCGFSQYMEVVCCPTDTEMPVISPTPPRPSTPTSPSPPTRTTEGLQDKTFKRTADYECERLTKILPPALQYYIVGGEMASEGEFPHMVAIRQLSETKGSTTYRLVCGGSLISTRFVLTAAHCRSSVSLTIVSLGFTNTSSLGVDFSHDYNLSHVHIHPEYKSSIKYHDLALLKLDRPVQISTTIYPACLYTGRQTPKNNLIITGWGAISAETHYGSPVLMKARLSLVPEDVCKSHYEPQRLLPSGLTEDQICASDSERTKDSCSGDSGGPLQAITSSEGHYKIVGVTSFGKSCASEAPGVYTRLWGYLDWIEGIVWPNNAVGLRSGDLSV